MISVERLTKAIQKLEARHEGVPIDERVAENRDYGKIVLLIETLKKYREQIARMDKMLTDLGV